jgi:hypothetical protein
MEMEIVPASDPLQSTGLASIPFQGCSMTAPLQCPCLVRKARMVIAPDP